MIIEIHSLTWERDDKTILNDLNWTVHSKENWCLLGLNGSGKTTLLNMITGYLWPTKGSISVLGRTFGETDLRELRKNIGWVSSSLEQMMHGGESAYHIVLSGKFASIGLYEHIEEADREQAKTLLHSLGCSDLMNHTFRTLSQGERQRVLIARALMSSPKLLILDEPCTGLDLIAREQLLQMISSIASQEEAPALIYVTHHVEEILPCFTKTLLLKQGQVFAAGDTDALLTSEMMSRFFDVTVQIDKHAGRSWLSIPEPLWKS